MYWLGERDKRNWMNKFATEQTVSRINYLLAPDLNEADGCSRANTIQMHNQMLTSGEIYCY